MATHRSLIVPLAALWMVSSVLWADGARADRRTINLLCGAIGTPCASDPNVIYWTADPHSYQQAMVGTGAPANPCAVEDHLGLPGKSRFITTRNSSDSTATFQITFSLPAMFGNPVLDIPMYSSDFATGLLNGRWTLLGSRLYDDNPLHFSQGLNTLVFYVCNRTCTPGPTARSGPDDPMDLQFEGTVSYDPPPAGGGLNLGWDDCGGQPASLNQTFACDTNLGNHTLVESFVTPCCVTAMSANEIVMDLESTGATLPPWWGMRSSGTCRSTTSLLSNVNFTAGPFTCYDYWQGGAASGISENPPVGNRARIKELVALPVGSPGITGILEGTEVYSFKVVINNARTTGLGACAGCATGVCIVLQSIKLNQTTGTPGGDKYISSPATRAYATWQGGIGSDCYAATPAKNVTWGSIKAQYR